MVRQDPQTEKAIPEVIASLREVLREEFGKQAAEIQINAATKIWSELGLDSLSTVILSLELEKISGVKFDGYEQEHFQTVGELARIIAIKRAEAQEAPMIAALEEVFTNALGGSASPVFLTTGEPSTRRLILFSTDKELAIANINKVLGDAGYPITLRVSELRLMKEMPLTEDGQVDRAALKKTISR